MSEPIDIPHPDASARLHLDEIGFEASSFGLELHLREILKQGDIDPLRARVVANLGCGVGIETQAISNVFPNAFVHAVDYYDMLSRFVNRDRVVFHQGVFVDVLQTGEIPPCDLVWLRHASRNHGFNAQTIHLLKDLVGKGVFIAEGDNGNIETEGWFKRNFAMIYPIVKYGYLGDGVYQAR